MALNFDKKNNRIRFKQTDSVAGIIAAIIVILLGFSIILGIIYGWTMLIAWAVNYIFGLAIPYTWQTTVAIIIINITIGATFFRSTNTKK